MLKKNDFFKDFFKNSSEYKKNIKKTKKIFNSFLLDVKNENISVLESFKKNYKFDFSNALIKKLYKYKNIVVIGMGGSILGAKSIYSFLQSKIKKEIFFIDNLDINLIEQYKKKNKFKNSCFIVISKSGNTLETIVSFGSIFSKKLLRNKLVIITEMTDSALMTIAHKYNADVIEHKEFIGGRYSVLSETGMFPAALMGLNLIKFKNLDRLITNKNFVTCLIQNVAAIYTLNSKKINNSIILSYDSKLNDLGYWYQQLVAESLGKKNKGINPMLSFCPKDHHSLLQLYLDGPKDKFFTFFSVLKKKKKLKIKKEIFSEETKFLKNKNVQSIIDAQGTAVKNIFRSKKIPFRQIIFDKENEENLGKIFTFFVLETILLSSLIKVNPFGQPAVEQVKIETQKLLS